MLVLWDKEALQSLSDTYSFWNRKTFSTSYSKKIELALDLFERELADDPYFLVRYIEDEDLYQRSFFKNRFYVYYSINEALGIISILYFRGAKQEPLFDFY